MRIAEMIGAAFGFVMIAAVLWKLRKGVPKNNGEHSKFEDAWNAPDSGHS